ncbi:MAG: hypothetical protein ACK5O8_05010 [Pirellula sp.]
MDDFKRYMNEAMKYSFWIVSGLVLLLASVIFYLTKSELDTAISSRKSTLETAFKNIQAVSSKTSTHPNEASHKEMSKRLDILKQDVAEAWKFQYERQKEFLTWPKDAFFQPKTYEIFDSLRPFEKVVPFPLPDKPAAPLDLVTVRDREVYRGYIAPEFPELSKRIGSSWKYSIDSLSATSGQGGFAPPMGTGGFAPPGLGGATGGTTASAGAANDSKDLVRWSESSQKELVSAILPWFSRQGQPPSIHEIYYAQEDIWVLRGLMDIIAQTNSEARENFQAVVREIEWIRTGSKVSRDAGALYASAAAAGGGGGLMGMGGMPGMGGGGPPAGYAGGGAGGGPPAGYGGAGGGKGGLVPAAVAQRVDPADGRYVDTNFKPLTGAQLRSAMNLATPNDAVIAVAKRIPVRLRLKVDESQIGRLITECGNGKMMLEVLQLRYNTDPAPAVGAAGGGGGGADMAGGSAKPSFGGAGGMGMMSEEGTSGTGGAAAAAGADESSTGEIPIEIFGLIYLFNPPLQDLTAVPNGAAQAPAANGAASPATGGNGAGAAAPANPNAAGGASPAGANPPAGAGAAPATPAAGTGTTPATPPGEANETTEPAAGTEGTPAGETPAGASDPAAGTGDGSTPTTPADGTGTTEPTGTAPGGGGTTEPASDQGGG